MSSFSLRNFPRDGNVAVAIHSLERGCELPKNEYRDYLRTVCDEGSDAGPESVR